LEFEVAGAAALGDASTVRELHEFHRQLGLGKTAPDDRPIAFSNSTLISVTLASPSRQPPVHDTKKKSGLSLVRHRRMSQLADLLVLRPVSHLSAQLQQNVDAQASGSDWQRQSRSASATSIRPSSALGTSPAAPP
jgi:hypothetical protein